MSGNLSASWASPGRTGRKAVSVRCPHCPFRTTRVKQSVGAGLYGFCPVCIGHALAPTQTREEKRAAKARAELGGLKGGKG